MSARPGQASGQGAGRDAPRRGPAAAGRSGPATAAPVMDRFRPRAREIVTAARQLLEDEGLDSFSMRRLADRLGVRAPVIYKHFASKGALVAALISVGFEEQAALFEAALTSDHPLTAMAGIYRAYGRDNPNLYRLMYDRDLERPLLLPGSEERAVIPAVRAAGGDRDLARAAWAFAHGMTILELNNRFPADADLDAAWRRGMASLDPASRVPGLDRSGHGHD
ncbi:MAG TPA: TetR/AcrR family transcriptional regulator [Streptosporangiaceae bacterium]